MNRIAKTIAGAAIGAALGACLGVAAAVAVERLWSSAAPDANQTGEVPGKWRRHWTITAGAALAALLGKRLARGEGHRTPS